MCGPPVGAVFFWEGSFMANTSYRAILFDLDGTLCPMELDEFLGGYFKDIARFAAEQGVDGEKFARAFGAGASAMAKREPGGKTNYDVFWDAFFAVLDRDAADWDAMFAGYYETRFGAIGADVRPNPAAHRALELLVAKGYPLVLATQPMFPRRAVEWRLAWGGVGDAPFRYISTYENSSTVKPQVEYYAEVLANCGLSADEVLMVGNNTLDDLASADLGCDVYLVTDHLMDPQGRGLEGVKHSTMAEFAAWVDDLPTCDDPATIEGGAN